MLHIVSILKSKAKTSYVVQMCFVSRDYTAAKNWWLMDDISSFDNVIYMNMSTQIVVPKGRVPPSRATCCGLFSRFSSKGSEYQLLELLTSPDVHIYIRLRHMFVSKQVVP